MCKFESGYEAERRHAYMAFTVSVGEADFAALRNDNAYYVDKTEIMYELVHDTDNKVTIFTRPRRFGKTLMMRRIATKQ